MSVGQGVAPGSIAWGRVGTIGATVLVGIVLGFLSVLRGCIDAPSPGVSQERYAVMLGTLYSEGEAAAASREYLLPLGNVDHAGFLTQLAERYGKSGERAKQRDAEALRQLADAVKAGVGRVETPSTERAATVAVPSTTARSPVVAQPTPTVGVPAATGTIRSSPGESVRMRLEPNTTAPIRSLLANGARVEILDVVEGQQVEKNEKRWYKVRSGQMVGYVYFPFVGPSD